MKIIKQSIIFFIQIVSKLLRLNNLRACRFYPSCSEYSVEAFQKMKAPRAFYLTAKRVLSCHPFSKGGYDPLPCLPAGRQKRIQRVISSEARNLIHG